MVDMIESLLHSNHFQKIFGLLFNIILKNIKNYYLFMILIIISERFKKIIDQKSKIRIIKVLCNKSEKWKNII